MKQLLSYKHYVRPSMGVLGLALLFGAIYGIANGVGLPLMIKVVFPKVFSGESNLSNLSLIGYASLIPALFCVRGIFGFFNTYLVNHVGMGVLEAIRIDFFKKLQILPLSFFNKSTSGDLLSRAMTDTLQVQQTLTGVTNDLIKQPITLLGALGFLGWLSWQNNSVMFLLLGLGIIPLCVFPVRLIGKNLLKRAVQTQKQLGVTSERVSENINAAKEICAFGLEERETKEFIKTVRNLFQVQMKVVKYTYLLTPFIEIITAVGVALSFYYAYKTQMAWVDFLSILAALNMCYDPIKKIGGVHNQIQRGIGAIERIDDILKMPVEISDPEKPETCNSIKGNVNFSQVSFSYGETPTLSEINVQIPAGTVCALVGPSGAGKSTFANLIPRFYDVTDGTLTVDDIDVRNLRIEDLRSRIAVVSQDPFLFNTTILENLQMGDLSSTREQIEKASQQAFAHEFIEQLPKGYDTMVGERGVLLSGGQKQRLAIARAFLRNAPILILDEATSSLDSESEEKIQTALRQLMQNKTVFIIAHRFSTIRDANTILVFDKGKIIATGNHSSLYGECALYKSLYDRQN
ncbi:MAG: ABC transporter ATP-binding protein [Opitutaceae bacterium]|nr:ABC transporter ATP-binding protein [Opitutaceae bacterium]